MINKRLFILVLLTTCSTYCQSWQWGKRGGALEDQVLSATDRQEETYSVVTDGHKNIYGLSRVGYAGLNIDNVVKTNFDTGAYPSDYALFSFGCDGSYRWSKIIGGVGQETVHPLQVDNQNNIYVAGRLGLCGYPSFPPRIDNDVILNQTPSDCRTMFLAKYNDSGDLQWIKTPQPAGVDQTVSYGETASRSIQTDVNGTTYWLVLLPPGTYDNGAFVNTMTGSNYFILKYDNAGNYLGNIPIDIQTTGGYGYLNLYRNPNNGYFYILSSKVDDSDTAIVAGHSVSGGVFIACFDTTGTYLWKREDTVSSFGYVNIYNLAFDTSNNIYLGGKIAGFSNESFLGFTAPDGLIPGFVMKTNPDASQVLWASHSNYGSENYGGVVINGNELGYTSYCFGTDFTWGTQVLNASGPNEGQKVLLARFNTTTGACIGLTKIPANVGPNNVGAAIAVDASGDYIVGGAIGGILYFDNNQEIVNSGSQSDFFVAKYATQACSPLSVATQETATITVYPNPVKDKVYLDNQNGVYCSVSVYSALGQYLFDQELQAVSGASVDVTGLSKGVYFLHFSGEGQSSIKKVIKE